MNTTELLREENEKYRRIIALILNKRVDVEFLKKCKNVEFYNYYIVFKQYALKESEFNLLKWYFGGTLHE